MSAAVPAPVPATKDDRESVVATVHAAFADDPAFAYFFGADQDARRLFAEYLFDIRTDTESIWLIDGGASVALWDPPNRPDGPGLPAALPAAARHRLRGYDKAVHGAFPTTPFWYLGVLATHPQHAGRRLGRAVMKPGLERARADGVPAYLETATARNVGLYERAGWEVTKELAVDGLDVWILRNTGG
jgi:GNAT superfamily N-acetyltransferase